MTVSKTRSYNVGEIRRARKIPKDPPLKILLPLAFVLTLPFPSSAEAGGVLRAEIDGVIHGVTAEYVDGAVERAGETGADVLVLVMNTPGGLVSSTMQIVESILASPTPVVLYVAPGGASATSGGFYIVLSSDLAVMSPGTRIGAAHPVTPFGENKKEDISMQKAENDLAAQARSMAQNRGRNVEISEKIVRESLSLTEKEALEEGLIDLVVSDFPTLVQTLDGMTLTRFDGREVVLDLSGAEVEAIEMTTRQRILAVVADPTVSFILLVVGVLGLYVEFTHPGLIFPGVGGGLCLILFAISTQILPLNFLGLLLIAGGIVMFVLEVNVTSYGLLTLGGIVAVTLGFLTLFEGPIPELRLPLSAVLPVSITAALLMAFLTQRAIKAQFDRVTTGVEGLQGELGTALTALDGEGKVFVHGEYWNARSSEPIAAGEKVRVRAVKDLVIEVERAEKS